MITLADRFTLARIFLAPVIVASYLFITTDYNLCYWVAGWLCAFAEMTDLLDGYVARKRNEVSDFGKLADPFCDVFYRITIFMMLLLPAGGVGYPAEFYGEPFFASWLIMPPVHVVGGTLAEPILGYGLVPWLPVWLMVLREIVAGALRSMTASKGLILAARRSGKIKAWIQGTCILWAIGMPAVFVSPAAWHLPVVAVLVWASALMSVGSMVEYILVNRDILGTLIQRKKREAND